MTGAKCVPTKACAEPLSYHWISPRGGDQEPWIWISDEGLWLRRREVFTAANMDERGWVYVAAVASANEVAEMMKILRLLAELAEAAPALDWKQDRPISWAAVVASKARELIKRMEGAAP